MKKVFIVNSAGHDYSKAHEHGEVVILTEGNINPMKLDRLLYTLQQKLKTAEEEDLILISGHQTINCLTAMVMMDRFDRANFLVFDAKLRTYIPRTITRSQLKEESHLVESQPNPSAGVHK